MSFKSSSFKKSFLAAAVLFTLTASGFSASMETVCQGLAAHPHTTGDFTQIKKIKNSSRSLKSSGNFIFSLEGIMWNTVKPFPSRLAVGDTQIIQTAGDGTQTVIDAEGNEMFASIGNTLKAVFTNDLVLIQKNFETKFTEEADDKWILELEPKDTTIKSVMKLLTLNGSSGSSVTLDSITMTEASENTITYTFKNQNYPKELSDAEKAFFVAK